MSGELQTTKNDQGKGLSHAEMFKVMSDTLYPGAQRESILMVLEYCRARNLDPILKPVHIVPMYCSTGKKDSKGYDIKAMRDVVMPGIGSYRITAARTKQCAGVSEPEFGEDVTEEFDGVKVTFPKWCKVTVKRKIGADVIAEFSAIEYWKENYATKGKGNPQPNAMWEKRPYGQISKCAEAQALRKAFPEVGSEPTADEMEGKEIDVTPQQETMPAINLPQSKAEKKPIVIEQEAQEQEKSASPFNEQAEEGQVNFIKKKLDALKNFDVLDVLKEAGVSSLDNLTIDGFNAIREALKGKS